MAKVTGTSWRDVEARNRAIDAAVPKHGAAHIETKTKLAEAGERGRQARNTALQAEKPLNPSGNTLPALSNRPKLALPASLKKQG